MLAIANIDSPPAKDTHTLFRLAQVADPTSAASMLTASMVDELACLLFFSDMQELWRLKNNLPAYLSTAAAWVSSVELDRNDMADYTEKVLLFWRSNAPKFSAWGRLARVFLSMAPSSAAVERIFSLCNHMFGDAQLSALADYVQGSLMLRANKRFHLLG